MRELRLIFVLALAVGVCALDPSSAWADRPEALSPQTAKLPTGPTGLKGLGESFSPSPASGTGQYSVPLTVPPATLTPQLTLVYAGGHGNGSVGLGFDLPILHVYRTTDKGNPSFMPTDRFAVSGPGFNDELVFVAETAGIRRYRLKQEEAYALFDYDSRRNLWIIRTSNGHRLELGEAHDVGGRTAGWFLRQHSDGFGHYVRFAYLRHGGQIYVERIRYGADNAPLSYENSVAFSYEARPDSTTDYAYGSAVTTQLRLSGIVMRHGDRRMRRYELVYEDGLVSSLLSHVRMFGEGDGDEMPTLSFEYVAPSMETLEFVRMRDLPPLEGLESGEAELEDVNLDGLPDLLYGTPEGYRYYENVDGIRWSREAIRLPSHPDHGLAEPDVLLADMDGDGQRDVVHSWDAGYRYWPGLGVRNGVALGYGGPVVVENHSLGVDLTAGELKVTDLNSDGRVDFLWSKAGDTDAVLLNRAQGSSRARLDEQVVREFPGGPLFPDLSLLDFNGDGMLDLVDRSIRHDSAAVRIWYGVGDGRFLQNAQALLGVPRGDDSEFHLLDVNRDGQSDLVRVSGSQVSYWLYTGEGRLSTRRGPFRNLPSTAETRRLLFADLNGNGTQDLVWLDHEYRLAYLDLVGEPNMGLLRRIDNGMGLVTELSYRSSTAYQIDDKRRGTRWRTPLPYPVPVLSELRTSDSLDRVGAPAQNSRTTFRYRDGYWDGEEREFRGFADVEVTEWGDAEHPTAVSELQIHVGRNLVTGEDEEALKGKTYLRLLRGADGTLYQSEESVWEVRRLCQEHLPQTGVVVLPRCGSDPSAKHKDELVSRAVAVRALSGAWEGTNEPRFSGAATEFDGWGRPVRTSKYGEVGLARAYQPGKGFAFGDTGVGTDEVIEEIDYLDNLDRWMVGLIGEERTTDRAGRVCVRSRKLYDDAYADVHGVDPANAARLTTGLLTLEQIWLEEEQRWLTQRRTDYTARGLVAWTEDATGARITYEYDAETGYFVTAELMRVGDRDAPREHRYTVEYDRGHGLPTAVTDPNGHTWQAGYDGLGRVEQLTDPGGVSTTEYEYVYGSPLSVTRSSLLVDRTLNLYRTRLEYTDGAGRVRLRKEEAEQGLGWVGSGFELPSSRGQMARKFAPFASSHGQFELPPAGALHERTVLDPLGRELAAFAPTTEVLRADFRVLTDLTQVRAKRYRPWSEETIDERQILEGATWRLSARKSFDGLGRARRLERKNLQDGQEQTERWTLDYDPAGRIIAVDGAGERREYRYDSSGVLRELFDASLGHTLRNATAPWSVRFAYDDAGRVLRREDALGQVQRWFYDLGGRIVRRDLSGHASRQDEVYRWHWDEAHPEFAAQTGEPAQNLVGRLAYAEHPTGADHTSYDFMGRPTVTLTALWNPAREGSTFAQQSRDFFISRARYRDDGSVVETLTGDRAQTRAREGLAIRPSYNVRGLLAGVVAEFEGRTYEPFADVRYNAQALAEQQVSGNRVRDCRSYDSRQQPTRLVTGASADVDCGRLDYSGGSGVRNLAYHWNYDGLLSRVQDLTLSGEQRDAQRLANVPRFGARYSYDYFKQLVAAENQEPSLGSRSYRYDVARNLIEKTVSARSGGAPNVTRFMHNEGAHPSAQRVARVQQNEVDTRLEYDAVGQLRAYEGFDLTFDVEGHVVRLERSDGTIIEHYYDAAQVQRISIVTQPEGERSVHRFIGNGFELRDGDEVYRVKGALGQAELRKTQGLRVDGWLLAELETYVLEGGAEAGLKAPVPELYLDLDGDGDLQFDEADLARARAAFWNEQPIGRAATFWLFEHDNHLGSVTHVTDETGSLVGYQLFHPHGELAARGGPSWYRGFTGQQSSLVADSGLVQMGARNYAPGLGRWVSPDRHIAEQPSRLIEHMLDSNLYAYVGNNPVAYVDPSGQTLEEAIVAARELGLYLGACGVPTALVDGIVAHQIIQAWYVERVDRGALTDQSVGLIVQSLVGEMSVLNIAGYFSRPDIYSPTSGEVWEIKPVSMGEVAALEATMYAEFLQISGLDAHPGVSEFGDRITVAPGVELQFSSTQSGGILYRFNRGQRSTQSAEATQPATTAQGAALFITIGAALVGAVYCATNPIRCLTPAMSPAGVPIGVETMPDGA